MFDLTQIKFDEAMFGYEEKTMYFLFTAPAEWLKDAYPEEDITNTELSFTIKNYGNENAYIDDAGISPTRWSEEEDMYEDFDWGDFMDIVDEQHITAAQILELARKGGYKG